MLTVVLVLIAVVGVWALAAVAMAFLAGGVIHARDHRDLPFGGAQGPHAVVSLAAARSRH